MRRGYGFLLSHTRSVLNGLDDPWQALLPQMQRATPVSLQARVAKLLASGEPLKAGAQTIQCALNLVIGRCRTVTREPQPRRPRVELSTVV